MSAIVFDSYAAVQRLKAAGFTEPQALALTTEYSTVTVDTNKVLDTFVTKDYLDERLGALQSKLLIQIGLMIFAATGLIVSILGVIAASS